MLLRRGLITIGALLLFLVSSVCLAINIDLRPHKSWMASATAPGIGFHLTPGYGTAAVRHNDGSTINIGRVEAGPAYFAMMKRLSERGQSLTSSDNSYPCDPYTWAPLGNFLDWKVFKRGLRKRFGLPATKDVKVIANLITDLRKKTEEHLGHAIDAAVLTYTSHESLCPEDFTDAFEYLKLTPLKGARLQRPPLESFAAYAGHGLGLCNHYTNTSTCRAETDAMPRNWTLSVTYTTEALIMGAHEYTSAYSTSGTYDGCTNDRSTDLVDYDLGQHALLGQDDTTDYWQRMRTALTKGAHGSWLFYRPTHLDAVIIHGEGQSHQPLDSMVRSVIELMQTDMPPIYSQDPRWVAARGAAEFAKRAQELQAEGGGQPTAWNAGEDL